jgi:predicted nucleic acid-binding protein
MAAVDALLDTSILIDMSRGREPAIKWLQEQSETVFGLPVLVCMEFVDGARDTAERERTLKMIGQYPTIHLTPADSAWAQEQHAKYKLSHNVGILDCLIASSAMRLVVPIYTLNIRHFSPLPDVEAIRPY